MDPTQVEDSTASIRIFKEDRDTLKQILFAWQAQTNKRWTLADVVNELVVQYAEAIK